MQLKPRKKRSRNLIASMIVIVAVYLFGCYWLARGYVSPPRTVVSLPAGYSERWVSAVTPAWIGPVKKRKGIAILVHGYGGNRESMLPVGQIFRDAGWEIVIPAMCGQDASKVMQVGFSVDEAKVVADCVASVAQQNPGVPIVLFGYSMGGAAVWTAASSLPAVRGVITEGAFGRFAPTVDDFFERKFGEFTFLVAPIRKWSRQISGKEPSSINPVEQALNYGKRPSLIIHGDSDVVVRPAQGRELASASGGTLWMIAECEHVRGLEVAPGEYKKRISSFLDQFTQS